LRDIFIEKEKYKSHPAKTFVLSRSTEEKKAKKEEERKRRKKEKKNI
jgi:hypothetical protein